MQSFKPNFLESHRSYDPNRRIERGRRRGRQSRVDGYTQIVLFNIDTQMNPFYFTDQCKDLINDSSVNIMDKQNSFISY